MFQFHCILLARDSVAIVHDLLALIFLTLVTLEAAQAGLHKNTGWETGQQRWRRAGSGGATWQHRRQPTGLQLSSSGLSSTELD